MWCKENKLTVNLSKTNFLIIKNYQNTFKLTKSIKFLEEELVETDTIKFLGVYIDRNMTWKPHINHLNKQLRSLTSLIVKCAKFLPVHVLKLVYDSFINSKISYCLESWGSAASTHLNKILVCQKRILRIIC